MSRLIAKFSQTQLAAIATLETHPQLGELKAVFQVNQQIERVWFNSQTQTICIEQGNSLNSLTLQPSLSYAPLSSNLEAAAETSLCAIGDYLNDAFGSEALTDGLSIAQRLLEEALNVRYNLDRSEAAD